jgi:hypothetical protein
MADEVFMSIAPRDGQYLNCNIEGIPLRVVFSGGVDYKPDISFNKVKLNSGKSYFHNKSGESDSFNVTVMIHEDDEVKLAEIYGYAGADINLDTGEVINTNPLYGYLGRTEKVITILDYYICNAMPVYVYSRAVGISESDLYLITDNGSRKQDNDYGYVYWDLTFTRYSTVDLATWQNTNTGVTKALKKYKQNKSKKAAAAKKATAKTKTTTKQKLKKCDYTKIKYSKTKKTSNCVKYMQAILYKKKFLKGKKSEQVDGWYGSKTKEAVKSFQKKHKTKYKCKTDGNVDKNTFKALCS